MHCAVFCAYKHFRNMSTDRGWTVLCKQLLMRHKLDRTAFTMLMCGAAIMDFEVGVGEVCVTFRVKNPISGGVSVEISDWEIPASQLKCNTLLDFWQLPRIFTTFKKKSLWPLHTFHLPPNRSESASTQTTIGP